MRFLWESDFCEFLSKKTYFTFLCWIWIIDVSQQYFEYFRKIEEAELVENLPPTQQAHNIKMTSYQRRCDVITSHRRWYDVILSCVPTGKLPTLQISA